MASLDKILLVTYQFPPAGGVAVQRALSLARYLPRNGHEVHVLCCRNPTVPVRDPGLLRRVPPEVAIHKAFSPEIPFAARQALWRTFLGQPGKNGSPTPKPKAPAAGGGGWKASLRGLVRRGLNPDPEIVWTPFAFRRARALVRQQAITTVIVTAPPFSSFLIGNRLKREFPGLRYVADFRDDWLGYYLHEFEYCRGDAMARRAVELEDATVCAADLVVNVTETLSVTMRRRYPGQPEAKFACIPNGYDPELFAAFQPRPHGTGKIVVTFTGTLHKTSSPDYFLDAVDSLPEADRARFETRFIGRVTPEVAHMLANRKSLVRTFGFLPQAEALRYIEETDFLLLTMLHAPGFTGKFLEYLATGKPILAITPRGGEVARVIEESGAGWYADPDDAEGIRRMVERAALGPAAAGLVPNRKIVERFSRAQLTTEYSRLIRQASPEMAYHENSL